MKLKHVLREVEEGEKSPHVRLRRYRWVSVSGGSGHQIWDMKEGRAILSSKEARAIDPNEMLEPDV